MALETIQHTHIIQISTRTPKTIIQPRTYMAIRKI
jgi:hypothetical protein